MLSLIEQRLKDRVSNEMAHLKNHVNQQLCGREAEIFWNDPLDREAPGQRITGEITSAGFDAEMNITVVIRFDHPDNGMSITVPRYLSELR
tara:strand:+ start:1183 stop:1455 length:273 start_codon:yes stop_codon:yes gene_type:complete